MTLPRHCKVCRLILHYPDLEKDDYNEHEGFFVGKGYCPNKHYEINVREYEDSTETMLEKIFYQEYIVQLSHREGIFYLHKDGNLVLVRALSEFKDWNYKDIDYVINKLDTLVNFS